MTSTIGLVYLSDYLAACAWGYLCAQAAIAWLRGTSGAALLSATVITWLWFLSGALALPVLHPLLGLAAYGALFGFVLRILGVSAETLRDPTEQMHRWLTVCALVLLLGSLALMPAWWNDPQSGVRDLYFVMQLLLAVFGLFLIEQMVRNTLQIYEWHMKFLGVALAILFAYDFVVFSDAVLFRAMSNNLESMRGIAWSAAVPLIMVVADRNSRRPLRLTISHRFAFGSTILLVSGLYLLLITLAAYYVRLFGGEWGDILQVLLLIIGGIGGALLASSSSLREQLRALLYRNLFASRYDYREEWRRITDALSDSHSEQTLPERAVTSMARAVQSPGGAIWMRTHQDGLVGEGTVLCDWRDPVPGADALELITHFESHPWIIDLREYPEGNYGNLSLSPWLQSLNAARFVIPLMLGEQLLGIVVLRDPLAEDTWNTDDFNLMRLAGRQSASFLGQHRSTEELSHARQFQAFSQMSAFVVHDIKTVVSQLSLLAANATRHRDNPAFIDDMIHTTQHAVGRMENLISQIRQSDDASEDNSSEPCDIRSIISRAIDSVSQRQPSATVSDPAPATEPAWILAHPETLETILVHLLRNAQDATADNGEVELTISEHPDWVILRLRDTGSGMSPDFLREELFKPFASTRGVAGMGIGAYQSRAYLRSLGGDLQAGEHRGWWQHLHRVHSPGGRTARSL